MCALCDPAPCRLWCGPAKRSWSWAIRLYVYHKVIYHTGLSIYYDHGFKIQSKTERLQAVRCTPGPTEGTESNFAVNAAFEKSVA